MASDSDNTNTILTENAFDQAYAEWAAGLSAYRAATDANDATRSTDLLNTIGDLFDKMIVIPAPTPGALFLKLEAIGKVPWTEPGDEAGAHLARLTADAGLVAMQAASAWLERWRSHGGSVCIDRYQDNRLSFFKPEFSVSPAGAAYRKRLGEADTPLIAENISWLGAHHSGAMNELHDLLDIIPGGSACIRAILEADPSRGEPTPEAVAAMQEGQ